MNPDDEWFSIFFQAGNIVIRLLPPDTKCAQFMKQLDSVPDNEKLSKLDCITYLNESQIMTKYNSGNRLNLFRAII